MDLNVKLQVFEGPLDLLLHLIEKNKVDIYDIPIAEITSQYMDYLDAMKRADLDIMSEFLVMAATLLAIKSKMLLPADENEDGDEEIDPRTELVEQLLEYKIYKCISNELRDRHMDADEYLFKAPTIPKEVAQYQQPVDVEELMSDITLAKLNEIFQAVLNRQEKRIDPIRSKFGRIQQEEISLDDKIVYLKDYCIRQKSFSFKKLLENTKSKTEVIVTFLAILELMKDGTVTIVQEHTFDDILVEAKAA